MSFEQNRPLNQMPGLDSPSITWDQGTAYDLFISQYVLHQPEKFGLRASWAAGVRSRLSPEDRATLEIAQDVLHPLPWIYSLPAPKDGASAISVLRQLPPAHRLPALNENPRLSLDTKELLVEVAARKTWDEHDLEVLRAGFRQSGQEIPRLKVLTNILDTWSRVEEFGECYLEALQAFQLAFFYEEERHIAPALRAGLERAQELAQELPVPELLEQLSQGIRFQELFGTSELVLAPSYWSTPLVFLARVSSQRSLMVFGARPEDVSLIAGEVVPDALLLSLKALADPTRLRILRFLASEPLSQVELARRLRLRAPTVTHHLSALRLAGLVQLTLKGKEERRYAARLETVSTLFAHIKEFLESEQ